MKRKGNAAVVTCYQDDHCSVTKHKSVPHSPIFAFTLLPSKYHSDFPHVFTDKLGGTLASFLLPHHPLATAVSHLLTSRSFY